MILVRRDHTLIPPNLLAVANRAQSKLEKLAPDERKAFIKKKGHIWRRFARYLGKMSYGKCWYSESKDAHTFQDIDHFRPKFCARRTDDIEDEGYPWLAFDWDNFRYSSQRANRPSTDEDTDETVGKGCWFPLLPHGKTAVWNDRCTKDERPVLLDPTVLGDVRLIEVKPSGLMGASRICQGDFQRRRVKESIKLLGLNLPGIVEARQAAMRAAASLIEDIENAVETADAVGDKAYIVAEKQPCAKKLGLLQAMTRPQQPFAAAVRAELKEKEYGEYCMREEEMGLHL